MTATKTVTSRFCEECLKFRQKKCKGKVSTQIHTRKYWGTDWGTDKRNLSGLNFCEQYEFDVRLYKFADGSGAVETIKHVRERQVKRDIENENQEAADLFDMAADLSNEDFKGLILKV